MFDTSSARLEPQTILVVGNGGREHALAWALARDDDVRAVVVAPGNGGTARTAKVSNAAVAASDTHGLVRLAQEIGADLTVIGPEDPLAAGVVDAFQAAGLAVFGPTAAAARIEASKSWARELMARHQIPQPIFRTVTSRDEAEAAVHALEGRCVLKADGLAAGKGVLVPESEEDLELALDTLFERRLFGSAAATVVVEERMEGEELSLMVLADGATYRPLVPAQDHKRIGDGDVGPNTGGMGAYAPAPIATPDLVATICARIVEPVLDGLAAEGAPFTGCLFCGLMITPDGPRVIEFNARFGDPETQVQLPLVAGGLARTLAHAAAGRLADAPPQLNRDESAVAVVVAASGYPGAYPVDMIVHGLAHAEEHGVLVFHAGTVADDGLVRTSGGRVLSVAAVRDTLPAALAAAYGAIGPAGVNFDGMHYRTDIGARALAAS